MSLKMTLLVTGDVDWNLVMMTGDKNGSPLLELNIHLQLSTAFD